MDPSMNHGLPPSLAATDPSLDYHGKGIDIATAAYVAELGYLANPVSTHIQSAEMHNQAVNSLALISGRSTINALDILSMIIASYLYSLCQALDLRSLQKEFLSGLHHVIPEEISRTFGGFLSSSDLQALFSKVECSVDKAFEETSTMDAPERMVKIASTLTSPLLDFLVASKTLDKTSLGSALASIPDFCENIATRATSLMDTLRRDYLSGARGAAPASQYLNKTRPIYEFVRSTLGIRMHGSENYSRFANGLGAEVTVGQNVSLIHEAIRDGKMQPVVVSMFS